MTINGLPLHPLIVHATVVGLPATAVLAVVYVARPNAQDRLRIPLLVMALVCAALVWLTVVSGKELRDTLGLTGAAMQRHQTWAGRLQWATYGFSAVGVLVGLLDQRTGWIKGLLHGLLVVGAVAVVVLCVLTGDAGAHLVYGNIGQ